MSSMMYKKLVVGIIMVACSVVPAYGMNEEQKKKEKLEILNNWSRYITDEKNKKNFHSDYFYTDSSFFLIQQIIDVDKDVDTLSVETLSVIELLCKTCAPKFKKLSESFKNFTDVKKIIDYFQGKNNFDKNVLNEILLSESLHDKKRLQIFKTVLRNVKNIGKNEYHIWFLTALFKKNALMIGYLMDVQFECFLNKDFYTDIFEEIRDVSKNFLKTKNELIIVLHFLFETIENFLNTNLERESNDTKRFVFLNKQKKQLFDCLYSGKGCFCFSIACVEKYWDFIDYCLERSENKIGVMCSWDILVSIVQDDGFTDEEKNMLLRHIISRAREQKTQKILFAHDHYSFFMQLAQKQWKSLLRYALYSGIDLHAIDENRNVLVCFLDCLQKRNVFFDEKKKLVTLFLDCLDQNDRNTLLNPEVGIQPLCRFYYKDSFDTFTFLVKSGAYPWSLNIFLAKELDIAANALTYLLMLNAPDKSNESSVYFDLSERWKYVEWIIKYAKKENKLERLLNEEDSHRPLICALVDIEDEQGMIAKCFVEHGAQFYSEMFIYLLKGFFYSEKQKIIGLKKLFKLIKHNELARFFDSDMNNYTGPEIWKLVQELERSGRKDLKACLYALYKNITSTSYGYVKNKINSGESKKIIKISSTIMDKIENRVQEGQLRYDNLQNSNHRYMDLSLEEKEKIMNDRSLMSIFYRTKDCGDRFATI